jgi:hypothetical protein
VDQQEVLDTARRAVGRDLTGVPAGDALDRAVEGRRWWLAQWPDGAPHVLGLLAQDVQEAVHDTLDRTWPACREPSCPEQGRHPLLVEPDLGPDPFWTCPETGLPVAAVGTLVRAEDEPAGG